jgi:hypothetical protein
MDVKLVCRRKEGTYIETIKRTVPRLLLNFRNGEVTEMRRNLNADLRNLYSCWRDLA